MGPLQKLWVKELRSGKHQQCASALHKKSPGAEGFCCLGIAARFVLAAHVTDVHKSTGGTTLYYYDGFSGTLSYNLQKRLRLSDDAVDLLARMNDRGCTFVEIADYIEENPHLVFEKEA